MNKKLKNQKGFTLIELIVVIAIIGILAAVAIPRFSGLSDSARIKADASTAAQIVSASRIQESDNGGIAVVSLVSGTPTAAVDAAHGLLMPTYMKVPTASQSGLKGAFTISGGGANDYVVSWGSSSGKTYQYTENVPFTATEH